jgi:3-oxoacyl-[acyl-carrier-protein] synthase III
VPRSRRPAAADDLDLLLVATTTPDLVFPSTACIVQSKLGMTNGKPAFDLQAVCSGFVYALSVADQFIKTGAARHVLVIGAETLSRITDWNDRGNCILWGDGAGAVVLGHRPSRASFRHAHPCRRPPQGTAAHHHRRLDRNGEPALMRMEGNAVFKMAVNTLDRIVDETLEANGLQKSDIDWLVPHQANIRIISATAKKLGMSMDNVVTTVAGHGNTSAASVPLAFDVAVRDGRIQRGQTVLMEAFGGGFTWGSALLKY